MNPNVANHFFEEIKEVAGFLSIGRVRSFVLALSLDVGTTRIVGIIEER